MMEVCDLLYQVPSLLNEVNKVLDGGKSDRLKVSKGFCLGFKDNIEKGVVILLTGNKVLDVFLVDDVSEFMKKAKSFGGIKSMYLAIYDLDVDAYRVVYEYLNLILKEAK